MSESEVLPENQGYSSRMAALEEADDYMKNHRVTDSWRVINRLRNELVRIDNKIIAAIKEGKDDE
jgi:hypothetical protein